MTSIGVQTFSVAEDTQARGSNDTTAAQSFSNGVYFVEFKHPLCSTDAGHDICVTIPSKAGFDVLYAADGETGVDWPTDSLRSTRRRT